MSRDAEKELLYSLLRRDYADLSDTIQVHDLHFTQPRINGTSICSGGIETNFQYLSNIVSHQELPFYIGSSCSLESRFRAHNRRFIFDNMKVLYQTEKIQTVGEMESRLLYRFRNNPLSLNRGIEASGLVFGKERYYIYILRGAIRRFR